MNLRAKFEISSSNRSWNMEGVPNFTAQWHFGDVLQYNIIFCVICCFKSASWRMSSLQGVVNCTLTLLLVVFVAQWIFRRMRCFRWWTVFQHSVSGARARLDWAFDRDGPVFLHTTAWQEPQCLEHQCLSQSVQFCHHCKLQLTTEFLSWSAAVVS